MIAKKPRKIIRPSPGKRPEVVSPRPKREARKNPLRARSRGGQTRPCPPIELAGKWVAWSADGRSIVASGDTLARVYRQVLRQKLDGRVTYERLPAATRRMAGIDG